jgi:hypothetical protein
MGLIFEYYFKIFSFSRFFVVIFWFTLAIVSVFFAPKFLESTQFSFNPPKGTASYDAKEFISQNIPSRKDIETLFIYIRLNCVPKKDKENKIFKLEKKNLLKFEQEQKKLKQEKKKLKNLLQEKFLDEKNVTYCKETDSILNEFNQNFTIFANETIWRFNNISSAYKNFIKDVSGYYIYSNDESWKQLVKNSFLSNNRRSTFILISYDGKFVNQGVELTNFLNLKLKNYLNVEDEKLIFNQTIKLVGKSVMITEMKFLFNFFLFFLLFFF